MTVESLIFGGQFVLVMFMHIIIFRSRSLGRRKNGGVFLPQLQLDVVCSFGCFSLGKARGSSHLGSIVLEYGVFRFSSGRCREQRSKQKVMQCARVPFGPCLWDTFQTFRRLELPFTRLLQGSFKKRCKDLERTFRALVRNFYRTSIKHPGWGVQLRSVTVACQA